MKNILLVGAPRAGKTTLSNMLKNKYQIIKGDEIRVAYHNTILNNSDMSSGDVGRTREFRNFLMEIFINHLKYNPYDNFLLDTVDVNLEDLDKLKDYNVTVIVLGYTMISPEEVVELQKSNDIKGKDWSFSLTDDIRLIKAKKWIDTSKNLKKVCEKHNYKFVDTSIDRDNVLNELVKWINTSI